MDADDIKPVLKGILAVQTVQNGSTGNRTLAAISHQRVYRDMKQEALEKLPKVRDELEAAVESVLWSERDGLDVLELRKRIYKHPEYDVEPDIRYIHIWLAELQRDGVVVHDWGDHVYLLPKYADKELDAYRPNVDRRGVD